MVPGRSSKWENDIKAAVSEKAGNFYHHGKGKALPVANRPLQQHGMCSLEKIGRNFLKGKLWLQEGQEEIFQAAKQSPWCCSEQWEPAQLSSRAFKPEKNPEKRAQEQSPTKISANTQVRAPAKPLKGWHSD